MRFRCRISGSVLTDQVDREPYDPRAFGFEGDADDDSETGFPPVLEQPAEIPPLPPPDSPGRAPVSEE